MKRNNFKASSIYFDQEIEIFKMYIELESVRFKESFTYTIHCDEEIETEEIKIPTLLIQPFVENAIWHGLLPARHEKRIIIRFTQCDNMITCLIEDNGIGIRESEKLKQMNGAIHHSLGLENLKKRIKIMNEKYDTNCALEIVDLKDVEKNKKGTRVTLQFNIINT